MTSRLSSFWIKGLKLSLLVLLILFTLISVSSEGAQASISYQQLSRERISQGLHLYRYQADINSQKTPVWVLEADLDNPYLEVEAMSSITGGISSSQDLKTMADSKGAVAAINADFFNLTAPHAPFGIHMEKGSLMSSPLHASYVYGFGLDINNTPHILNFAYEGKITAREGKTFNIHGYNQPSHYVGTSKSHENRLHLYDRFWGQKVPASFFDLPLLKVVVNDGIVTHHIKDQIEVNIPAGGYVLVGHGPAADFLKEHAPKGAAVSYSQKINPQLDLKEAVGGSALLVENGIPVNPIRIGNSNLLQRHARTALGISRDQKTMWMVNVEGSSSVPGMSLDELAQFLVQLGAYRGLNMDGGGSATMVAQKLGEFDNTLINQPRWGSMRRIPNALGFFNAAPRADLRTLIITGRNYLMVGSEASYQVKGYDQNYHPVEIDLDKVEFSAPEGNGTFAGNTFKAEGSGSFKITASYQTGVGEKNLRVYGSQDLRTMEIIAPRKELPLQEEMKLTSQVTTDDGREFQLQRENVQWSSDKPDIAKIDEEGKVKALEPGKAVITATLADGGKKATLELRVIRMTLPRLWGENRYKTAVEISKKGWDSADTVILARGDHYADALAGAPLAYQLEAPLLLTPGSSLAKVTGEEIKRLGASRVILLGGEGALSPKIEEDLKDLPLKIERIAGRDRFHTAGEIARQLSSPEGEKVKALIAYGHNFPDALAAASYAARGGHPILLTEKDSLPGETRRVLEDLEIEGSVVAGGPAVISEKVFKELPGAVRVAGENRYATAVELSRHFAPSSPERYAATGLDFADAVAGAVLAARQDQGILLVGDKVPPEVKKYVEDKKIQEVTLLGGSVAICNDLESRLALMLYTE